jgi:prolyl-tRNA synthetase
VIVGKTVTDGKVELWDRRSNERTSVPIAEIAARVVAEVR